MRFAPLAGSLVLLVLPALSAVAQDACCAPAPVACAPQQAYRVSYRLVYDTQEVTAYHTEYETTYETKKVVTYRPQMFTQMREEQYTVQKPVRQTAVRTEYRTTMEQCTTYRTQYVDQGCWETQQVVTPGRTSYRLRWQEGTCVIDPNTGQNVWQRGGLYWTPHQGPAKVTAQRVWKPNVVPQQIPVTTLQPKTVACEVPYEVCKMVCETHTRQVPVQVCKMVAVEQEVTEPRCVQKCVPYTYTVQKPRYVACYQPVDACGNPCGPCAVPGEATAAPLGAAPGAEIQGGGAPAGEQSALGGANGAGAPKIGPTEAVPMSPEERQE